MAARTTKRSSKGRTAFPTSNPKRQYTPPKRTRTAAAAKMVVDRRRVLAFGVAAAAATLVPVPAFVTEAATASFQPSFIDAAKRAIKLVEEWRRLGDELEEVDAALKSMSRADSRRSGYLVRVNDLPVERFRAALIADDALRSTMRMKIAGRKEAAIRDTLLLSLMEMTGKQPPVLKRELGLAT